MINVNLVSSKRKRSRKLNYYYLGLYSVFGIFAAYFLYSVVYVIYFQFATRNELKKTNDESVAISTQITKDSERVNNYVMSKFILLEIEKLNKSKFGYKKYLDQIVLMLPLDNELKAIDFAKKEEIQFRVESVNLKAFGELEKKMSEVNLEGTDFTYINSTGINKTAEGAYLTNFIIGINAQNGK